MIPIGEQWSLEYPLRNIPESVADVDYRKARKSKFNLRNQPKITTDRIDRTTADIGHSTSFTRPSQRWSV
jgi:hypothetical protein